jgi:hypothetical protein
VNTLRLLLAAALVARASCSHSSAEPFPARRGEIPVAPQKARDVEKPRALQTLYGVEWQPTLEAAQKAAQETPRGKPILVLRLLGKLDDKL